MKRFIKNLLAFLLVLILACGLVVGLECKLIGNQYEDNFQASIIDKINRLQSIDEPKIILVGNSNVAFGFRSEMLEDEFGMPVVNLGLHGGLGNRFLENMAKYNIGEGDIVILCHSDYDVDGDVPDIQLAWITLEYHTELWGLIKDSDDPMQFAIGFPKYMYKATMAKLKNEERPSGCYSRAGFNEYGDVVGNFENTTFPINPVTVPSISDETVERINELNTYCQGQGATLLIAGFPVYDYEETPDKSEYDTFEEELRSRVDCQVISHFSDYFIGQEYYYDTILHLTDEGDRIRTQILIDDLKQSGAL